MVFIALLILGLVFGSFLDAVVWRMHAKRDWVRDRSRCDHCEKILKTRDLIPLVSWMSTGGRCRYCKAKISWQHPLIELVTALAFSLSYLWWPTGFVGITDRFLFAGWLACLVGLIALAVYDLKWMLLPNKIIYPTLAISVAVRTIFIIQGPKPAHAILLWVGSLAVASGFFWLLFMASRGRWIGYGDVRLGLVTGTLLATPALSFLMIFFASVAGTLVAVPLLASKGKSLQSRLPYGPYLIAATYFVFLFGQSIIDWYNRVLVG